MTTLSLVSLIASIASLVLAILAICLSIVFFRMSNEASKETKSASKDVSAAVERLEKLFDKLYSDTFSIMKDTVSDMRKHIWYDPAQSRTTSDLSDSIKSEISSQISEVLEKENISGGGDRQEITRELERVFENAIKNQVAKRPGNYRDRVLAALDAIGSVKLSHLASFLEIEESELAIKALFPMRNENIITWDGNANSLSSDNFITRIKEESAADSES